MDLGCSLGEKRGSAWKKGSHGEGSDGRVALGMVGGGPRTSNGGATCPNQSIFFKNLVAPCNGREGSGEPAAGMVLVQNNNIKFGGDLLPLKFEV